MGQTPDRWDLQSAAVVCTERSREILASHWYTCQTQHRKLEPALQDSTGKSLKQDPCGLCDSPLLDLVSDSGGIWVLD